MNLGLVFKQVLAASAIVSKPATEPSTESNPGSTTVDPPISTNPCVDVYGSSSSRLPGLALNAEYGSCLYRMGRMYRDGLGGMSKDDKMATYYFEMAANAGHLRGSTDYAFQLLYVENGCDKDAKSAAAQIYQSLANGPHFDPESQLQLAHLYFDGNGVERDDVAGLVYLKMAADRGNNQAQNELCQRSLKHCN